MSSGKEHSTTSLGPVTEANAAKVLVHTGHSIAGYERLVQSSDIRHVLRSHGDPVVEAARGQVAVRKRDLVLISAIVEAAHEVSLIGIAGARKTRRLQYVAHLHGHEYRYVEELRGGDAAVALKTLRKRDVGGARGE